MSLSTDSPTKPQVVPWRERARAWAPGAFALLMLLLAALDPDSTPVTVLFVVLFLALLCFVVSLTAITAHRRRSVFDRYNGYTRATETGIWVGLLIPRLYPWREILGVDDHETYSDIQTSRGPLRLRRGWGPGERVLAMVREALASRGS